MELQGGGGGAASGGETIQKYDFNYRAFAYSPANLRLRNGIKINVALRSAINLAP